MRNLDLYGYDAAVSASANRSRAIAQGGKSLFDFGAKVADDEGVRKWWNS